MICLDIRLPAACDSANTVELIMFPMQHAMPNTIAAEIRIQSNQCGLTALVYYLRIQNIPEMEIG